MEEEAELLYLALNRAIIVKRANKFKALDRYHGYKRR